MSVNYKVRADVVDIQKDRPQSGDVFLVDTNSWFWHTYTRASLCHNSPAPHQLKHYPSYIAAAITAGATIYRSVNLLVELSRVIEFAEAEIYRIQHNVPALTVKEFRHQPDSVIARYRSEIDSAWSQIESMTTPLDQLLNGNLCAELCASIQTERLDGYDALLVLLAKEHGVTRIISDDGDLSTVAGITLHTANARVLGAAVRANKYLIPRE